MSAFRIFKYVENCLLLVFLSFYDWYFTKQVLAGGGTELNPVAAFIIAHFGMIYLLAFKLTCAAGIGVYCAYHKRLRLLIIANFCAGVVCAWMLVQFLRVLQATHQ